MVNSLELAVLDDAISIHEMNLSEDQMVALTCLLRVYILYMQIGNDNKEDLSELMSGVSSR